MYVYHDICMYIMIYVSVHLCYHNIDISTALPVNEDKLMRARMAANARVVSAEGSGVAGGGTDRG